MIKLKNIVDIILFERNIPEYEKKFGKVLFGEFSKFHKKDKYEKNTKYEDKIWNSIVSWIRGEYKGKKRDAAIGLALNELMKYKDIFPKILKTSGGNFYRGIHNIKFLEKNIKKIDKKNFKRILINNIKFISLPFVYVPESKIQSWSRTVGGALKFTDKHNSIIINANISDNELIFNKVFLNAISRFLGYGSENEVIRIGNNIKCNILLSEIYFGELFPDKKIIYPKWKRGDKLNWKDAPELYGKRRVEFQFFDNRAPYSANVLIKKKLRGGKKYVEKNIILPIKDLLYQNTDDKNILDFWKDV